MFLEIEVVFGMFPAEWHIHPRSLVREILKNSMWRIAERGRGVSHVWKSLEVEDSLSILAFS
jgi:hypothetical protein